MLRNALQYMGYSFAFWHRRLRRATEMQNRLDIVMATLTWSLGPRSQFFGCLVNEGVIVGVGDFKLGLKSCPGREVLIVKPPKRTVPQVIGDEC